MYARGHAQGPTQGQAQGARSPPPLQHPRPQHPPSNIPSQSPPPDAYAFTAHRHHHAQQHHPHHHQQQQQQYQRFGSPPHHQQPAFQSYQPAPAAADPYAPANSTPYPAQSQPPPAQQQHPQPQARPQPQGQGWPPAMDSFGMNDATAQIGVQFGKQALTAGQAYLDSHFVRLLPLAHLKHSFNVSNSYVLNKIRLVLFPWRHRPWSRSVVRNESTGVAEGWKPPRDDLNCPDLYIPVMALVTYILLSGVAAGKAGTFDPRILGQSASRAFGILLLEFVCIRLGCYLLGIGEEGTVVDLVSYEGYKFVGVIVALVAGLVGASGWSFWLVFTYVVLANFFFQLRSLRHLVLPDPSLSPLDHVVDPSANGAAAMHTGTSSPTSHAQRARRIQFLFVIAAAQTFSMGILVRV